MKATRANGDGGNGPRRPPQRLSAAARVRRGGAEFLPSFTALQGAVQTACAAHTRWEAKVAAGILAALEFCAAEPAAAKALTINARRQEGVAAGHEQQLFSYFAGLLAGVTPSEARFPISTDEGIIVAVAVAVRGHLLAGTPEQLPKLAPELIYLALMPYTGLAGARRWTESRSLIDLLIR